MVEMSVFSEKGHGFSWISPTRMIHKRRVNVAAVLFVLDLYGGGGVGIPVEQFDLRHFSRAMV